MADNWHYLANLKPAKGGYRRNQLSRTQLLIFILCFGLIGFLITKSFALPNPNLQGDLNNDNKVDVSDLSVLATYWKTSNPTADIDNDGTVDLSDLAILLAHYGQTYEGGGTTYTPKYYVSPSGSDSNNGTSASTPWKTIAKVRNTCLQPGDVVAFQGGQTFSDSYMDVNCSGTSANPIVYTSYGTGKASITGGVWFAGGHHDVVLDNLDFSGNAGTLVGSCGSCSSNPTYDITVQNSSLHDTIYGGLQCSTNDHDWIIRNNTFQHTGDSGIIDYYCNNVTITHNTFTDIGYNAGTLGYATHAIYSKSANATISYNDISNVPNGQALSIRTHGQNIYGNYVHDTPYAIGFFDYDTGASPQGTTYIYYNRFYNISGWSFYYAGQTDPQGHTPSVSFVLANNTFVNSGGEMFNLSEVPSVASINTINNIFSGSFTSGYRSCATCAENHNLWFGGSSNIPNGTGDSHSNPLLGAAPSLTLSSGSPAIDAGTTSVPGLAYSLNSDGAPLHYNGSAPDMGAVEH